MSRVSLSHSDRLNWSVLYASIELRGYGKTVIDTKSPGAVPATQKQNRFRSKARLREPRGQASCRLGLFDSEFGYIDMQ